MVLAYFSDSTESKELDYDKDENQLEEKQEEKKKFLADCIYLNRYFLP
ncbi:MAG: hypothetical protein ACR2IS_10750 [Nitrososphaeraceae archaeon]